MDEVKKAEGNEVTDHLIATLTELIESHGMDEHIAEVFAKEVVEALRDQKEVKRVVAFSFTCGVGVGQTIAKAIGKKMKEVALEGADQIIRVATMMPSKAFEELGYGNSVSASL